MTEVCPQLDNCLIAEDNLKTIRTSFEWKLKNYSNFSRKPGGSITSDYYTAGEDLKTKWSLNVFRSNINFVNYFSVYVYSHDWDDREVSTEFKVAIIDANKQIYTQRELVITTKGNWRWGWPHFIRRDLLEYPNYELLPNDCLTIGCEVTTVMTTIRPISVREVANTLTDDMTQLYQNLDQNDCDVDIIVKGHKFIAHKLILKTRSPIFETMFSTPMKESHENRIIINDIDSRIFAIVLRFIYTDIIDNEDIDTIMKVLAAADKYYLHELKSICEDYIGSQLTKNSAIYVLLMADKYWAQKLRSEAIKFIKTNFNKVVETNGWKKLIKRSDLLHLFQ